MKNSYHLDHDEKPDWSANATPLVTVECMYEFDWYVNKQKKRQTSESCSTIVPKAWILSGHKLTDTKQDTIDRIISSGISKMNKDTLNTAFKTISYQTCILDLPPEIVMCLTDENEN